METPCTTHPDYFVQYGEDPGWHITPGAHWAAQQCRTACPLGIETCARNALRGGTLVDNDPNTRPRVASGVVQAGVICRGDVASHQQLLDIAYPDGDRPTGATTDGCEVCGRTFITAADLDPDDEYAHRATANSPLCRGCYSTARRNGHLQPMRPPTPTHCLGCEKPMTARTRRRPDTVRHESGGYCSNCCREAQRKGLAA